MKKIIALLAASIVGIQVVSIIFQFDIWPMSNYAMFSETKDISQMRGLHLEAIGNNGSIRRVGKPEQKPLYEALDAAASARHPQEAQAIVKTLLDELNIRSSDGTKSVQLVRTSVPNSEGVNHSREVIFKFDL